jgi:hypothetical protein
MQSHPVDRHPYRSLFTYTGARSRRASSWDRSGGNMDFVMVGPGQTVTLLEHEGPGCITHVYCALAFAEITDYRDAIIRCYWDGEHTPSVEVPLGDFFGLAHGRIRHVRSAMTAVNPGFGSSHGLSSYFPMPFAGGARITIEHRGDKHLGGLLPALWYHIDYETYDQPPPDDALRFHAQYRQEKPTTAVGNQPNVQLHAGKNQDGAENYVALEAAGRGQMAGLLLEINNVAGAGMARATTWSSSTGRGGRLRSTAPAPRRSLAVGPALPPSTPGRTTASTSSSRRIMQALWARTGGSYTIPSASPRRSDGPSSTGTPTTLRTNTPPSPSGTRPSHTLTSRSCPRATTSPAPAARVRRRAHGVLRRRAGRTPAAAE